MNNVNKKSVFEFDKSQRLLASADFKPVFDTPSFKVHQPNILFFVKMQEQNPTKPCRLGLAITKKKLKRANQRNRLKRLVREYFRLNQADFVAKNMCFDVVLIVKISTQDLPNEVLNTQIQAGFQQIIHKAQRFSSVQFTDETSIG